ncbi:hypothetical protein B1T51_08760 [Mycobacterium kansasii]|nr:PE family protein [Mycobacterium kansasii]ARG74550.1 hypothetical protein B1T51_08760 [Mycobacterium kansasii]
MSYLVAGPEYLSAAANSLAGIGSTLGEANAAAAASTTRIFAPALDEVSKAATALFSQHAQAYQAFSAHAARFHEQFVRTLATSAGLYHSTETFNALGAAAATNPLTAMNSAAQNLLAPVNAVSAAANAQSLALTGRPLVGNGANGGPGQPGKPGGWLGGNGGRGGDGLPGQPGGRGGDATFGNGGAGGRGGIGGGGGGPGGGGREARATGGGEGGGGRGGGPRGTAGGRRTSEKETTGEVELYSLRTSAHDSAVQSRPAAGAVPVDPAHRVALAATVATPLAPEA